MADARAAVARFAESHPALVVSLAVDLRPGASDADYDLLLGQPDGGTVAVSWRAGGGNPWMVDYAEHWAANFVLSIGDVPVTVQQALTALEIRADESPGLIDSLVDDALLERAMDLDPPEVTDVEAQNAMDSFRAGRGLHSAAETREWLARTGWSADQFQALVSGGVRARKMVEQLTAGQIQPYFEQHAAEFDVVRLFHVETRSAATAQRLVEQGARQGLLQTAATVAAAVPDERIEGTLSTVRAHELPAELSDTPTGGIAGPVPARGRFVVAEVLARHAATFDDATQGAVRAVLIRRWLDARRAENDVRWHWL